MSLNPNLHYNHLHELNSKFLFILSHQMIIFPFNNIKRASDAKNSSLEKHDAKHDTDKLILCSWFHFDKHCDIKTTCSFISSSDISHFKLKFSWIWPWFCTRIEFVMMMMIIFWYQNGNLQIPMWPNNLIISFYK